MKVLNNKVRVYDNRGRERWMAVNEVVPAGWYDTNCDPIEEDHIVVFGKKVNGDIFPLLKKKG